MDTLIWKREFATLFWKRGEDAFLGREVMASLLWKSEGWAPSYGGAGGLTVLEKGMWEHGPE